MKLKFILITIIFNQFWVFSKSQTIIIEANRGTDTLYCCSAENSIIVKGDGIFCDSIKIYTNSDFVDIERKSECIYTCKLLYKPDNIDFCTVTINYIDTLINVTFPISEKILPKLFIYGISDRTLVNKKLDSIGIITQLYNFPAKVKNYDLRMITKTDSVLYQSHNLGNTFTERARYYYGYELQRGDKILLEDIRLLLPDGREIVIPDAIFYKL